MRDIKLNIGFFFCMLIIHKIHLNNKTIFFYSFQNNSQLMHIIQGNGDMLALGDSSVNKYLQAYLVYA
jgi:hypothetical protein